MSDPSAADYGVACLAEGVDRGYERVVPDRLVGLTVKHACTIALT